MPPPFHFSGSGVIFTTCLLDISLWLVLFLSLCSCVEAGHRSWEPSRYQLVTNKPNLNVGKRWFTIQPRENGVRVWPDATIKYCFETNEAKERLLYNLEAARDRWYQNGLPEEKFQLTEVSAAECSSNRANILLIRYNDQGRLSTTPGLPPLDANVPSYKGPTMDLSDREDVGMLEVIANYAHELGHAWGLLHEHQNPSFWSAPYGPGQSQIFRFNCQNLKDYQELVGRLPDDRTQLCEDRAFAAEQRFSAAEYLPINLGRGPQIAIASDDDVDWASIMIYPSGAGATGSASPGNDQRSPILVRASDGSSIPINLHPSRKDIEGIQLLYSIDWPTTRPVLISEPANPKSSKFRSIFKKNKCL